ncbi:hypothetical protein L083_1412 [Actinoplanes sp. N902-109]|nr:hypothetical protein L083_1412 [Actinoplanes sp. N902-109]
MNDTDLFCTTELEEWRRRFTGRPGESARKKAAAATAATRRARQARRAHGLINRHAARLARLHPDTYPFPPDPECSE